MFRNINYQTFVKEANHDRRLWDHPHCYNDAPERFCLTCQSFTSNIDSRGQCKCCGNDVTIDARE